MVTATMQPVTEPEIGRLQFGRGSSFEERAISPYREMGAYEILWSDPRATFKSLSKRFAQHPGNVPSDFVPREDAISCAAFVMQRFAAASIARFGVCVHGASEYPARLRDAAHPIELLYYQGCWDLVASRSVAVVGTRKPSRDGLLRTRRLGPRTRKRRFHSRIRTGRRHRSSRPRDPPSRAKAAPSPSSGHLCRMSIQRRTLPCRLRSQSAFCSSARYP